MHVTSAFLLPSLPMEGQLRKDICVSFVLEVAWDRMLRAAQVGKLVGLTREAPEQPYPILYKQLVSLRTQLLSKNLCSVTPLFPLLSRHPDSLTISTEIPLYFFFLDFTSCSLAFTDGERIQASLPKYRDDLCSISVFPCQALKPLPYPSTPCHQHD